jgi:hypothetical protein
MRRIISVLLPKERGLANRVCRDLKRSIGLLTMLEEFSELVLNIICLKKIEIWLQLSISLPHLSISLKSLFYLH